MCKMISTSMKKKSKVTPNSIIYYALIIFIINIVAYYLTTTANNIIFVPLVNKISYTLIAIGVYTMGILVNLFVPLLGIFIFFRSAVPPQYNKSNDKWYWLKSYLRLVLPGEIFRFFACTTSLGFIGSTGQFSLLPTILFDDIYLNLSGRHTPVRQNGEYILNDFLAYTGFYLLYAAVHLFLVSLIYRHFWLKAKRERDDLIIYEEK